MEAPNLADLVRLDDPALIAWRRETRTELECHPDKELQLLYDATTQEMAARAGGKWDGQRQRGTTESAGPYARMSDPLLMAELRHLRGELEKLTARGEAALKELDKRLTARNGRAQPTGSDAA